MVNVGKYTSPVDGMGMFRCSEMGSAVVLEGSLSFVATRAIVGNESWEDSHGPTQQVSMILPPYPGKIPQTSPNPRKERNSET